MTAVDKLLEDIRELNDSIKGGRGSGFRGHKGRKGKRGGSVPRGSSSGGGGGGEPNWLTSLPTVTDKPVGKAPKGVSATVGEAFDNLNLKGKKTLKGQMAEVSKVMVVGDQKQAVGDRLKKMGLRYEQSYRLPNSYTADVYMRGRASVEVWHDLKANVTRAKGSVTS